MSDVYTFHRGQSPLLISVPHDGRRLAGDMQDRMTAAALDLPDTDWHVARLYAFAADLGASIIVANYSRYVVDLNRSAEDEALYDGQVATGLCPSRTFAGAAIYRDDSPPGRDERKRRIDHYWRPYHDRLATTLDDIRDEHGHALLWDAHSIPSSVPRLFDGRLPVLNIGSFDGQSCDTRAVRAVSDVAGRSEYSTVVDGRFKGGYITRHYGRPAGGIHALQMEIAQRAYMSEKSRCLDDARMSRLQLTLRQLLQAYVASAAA